MSAQPTMEAAHTFAVIPLVCIHVVLEAAMGLAVTGRLDQNGTCSSDVCMYE